MSLKNQNQIVDQDKVTKIRKRIAKFTNDNKDQIEQTVKYRDQQESQIYLSWQVQKNEFSNSPGQKLLFQQEKEQTNGQQSIHKKGQRNFQLLQKSKLNQKLKRKSTSSKQKLNYNFSALQKIQELTLQGKKMSHLPEKSQVFMTPQNKTNISLESKNSSIKSQKLINKSIDYYSQIKDQKHIIFPIIKNQQQQNLWEQNQQPLSQANKLISKSQQINYSSQLSDQESREQRKILEASNSIQKKQRRKKQSQVARSKRRFLSNQ